MPNQPFQPKALLCKPYSVSALVRVRYPAIAQVKRDGARLLVCVSESGGVRTASLYSRNGLSFKGLNALSTAFAVLPVGIYDGELLFGDLDRQASNGLAERSINGTLSEEQASLAHAVLWDYLTPDEYAAGACALGYADRWERLQQAASSALSVITLVETRTVATIGEALEYYNLMRTNGQEGIVVKALHGLWKITNGREWRAPHQVKMKEEFTAELRVVAIVEGIGGYAGMAGALVLVSDDGHIACRVSSGLSRADRDAWWQYRETLKTLPIDRRPVIEVRYNALTHNDGDTQSLYLPRYVRQRPDRDTTSSLAELQETQTIARQLSDIMLCPGVFCEASQPDPNHFYTAAEDGTLRRCIL